MRVSQAASASVVVVVVVVVGHVPSTGSSGGTDPVDGAVMGDPEDPRGGGASGGVEVGRFHPDLEEYVLGHVFCFGAIGQEAPARTQHPADHLPVELVAGVTVPGFGVPQQVVERVRNREERSKALWKQQKSR